MSRHYAIRAAIAIAVLAVTMLAWSEPTPPIMPRLVETPLPTPVTLPATVQAPADLPNRPLTAAEAAVLALHHQPSITVAVAGVTAAQGRVQQAKSGAKPGVTLNAAYADDAISNGSSIYNFTASANARQLLYDYNRTRDLARQATALERSAHANLTRVQSDLVFQVKLAFYQYAQSLRAISVNEENVRTTGQHLALAQARVAAGVGLPADVVRAQTAVADAIFSLNLAQNASSVARVLLLQLMGIDPRTPITVAEGNEPSQADASFDTLLATALQQRPEIQQGQANLQAAQYGINIAKTTNAPVLVGTATYGLRNKSFPPTDDNLLLGVAVQWGVLDGGLTAGRVTEARANVQASQAVLASTQQAVAADVAQAYLNVKTAEQRVVTADAEVANAQESLRLVQGRYAAGLGIFLDIFDAQAALVTAETNRISAVSSVNQARAALAHALNNDPTLAAMTTP
ncbi:MAG TPA: TolC family protein [Armatimonadota bacterium]|jgi:outer membrane protein TolC